MQPSLLVFYPTFTEHFPLQGGSLHDFQPLN